MLYWGQFTHFIACKLWYKNKNFFVSFYCHYLLGNLFLECVKGQVQTKLLNIFKFKLSYLLDSPNETASNSPVIFNFFFICVDILRPIQQLKHQYKQTFFKNILMAVHYK